MTKKITVWGKLNNPEEIRKAIVDGADVNAADNDGHTALREAARFGNLEAMKILLEAGANPDVRTADGSTLLEDIMCDDLLEHMNNVSHEDRLAVLSLLLEYGANPNAHASYYHNGGEVNQSLLHKIISGCYSVDFIELLLKAGANPNARDMNNQTPLICLARAEYYLPPAVLAAMEEMNEDDEMDADDMFPVRPPIDKPRAAKLLIAAGAEIDAIDNDENTAMSIAKANGDFDLLNVLEAGG